MPFSSDAVANYFIDKAAAKKRLLTPLKLQKLAYFAHGWHLALSTDGDPLVAEPVEAWEYGPVFPDLYHEFKDFGNKPISRHAAKTKYRNGKFFFSTPTLEKEAERRGLDFEFAKAVMERIWDVYGRYSATTLSEKTHEKGSPWWMVRTKARKKFDGRVPQNLNIPNELIRDWFKKSFQIQEE